MGGQIWEGQIWGSQIWEGQIWGGQIWGSQIWGGQIRGGQILGGQIWGGQIWGGQMWGGQMWGGQIWGGQIWGGRLKLVSSSIQHSPVRQLVTQCLNAPAVLLLVRCTWYLIFRSRIRFAPRYQQLELRHQGPPTRLQQQT